MTTKKCIVSFASNGREQYCKAQLRLIKSCVKAGWDGDYLIRSLDGYVDKYEGVYIKIGSWPENEKYGVSYNNESVPYQFKPYIIQEAREAGADVVVWCDSTVTMEKDISPLLEIAKEKGVVAFHNLGHDMQGWISDIAAERLKVTDDDLWGMPQIMACVTIFDFTNEKGVEIFDSLVAASNDGVSFQNGYGSRRVGFVAHRHDQAVLSVLLAKNKITLEPYGKLVYEPYDQEPFKYGKDIFFVNRAIK